MSAYAYFLPGLKGRRKEGERFGMALRRAFQVHSANLLLAAVLCTAFITVVAAIPVQKPELRINFGGEKVGSFESDHSVVYVTAEKDLFTAQAIPPGSSKQLQTGDIQVYWSQKASTAGALEFVIPNLESGTYDLTLMFSENYRKVTRPGQRLLHVQVSGCQNETVLEDFDIFKEAGGNLNTGVVSTHSSIRVLDHLRVTISSRKLTPVLNGLVLQQSTEQHPAGTPSASSCGNPAYGQVRQVATPQVSTVSRTASFDAVLRQTCIDDAEICHCVGTPMSPEAQCLTVFNDETVPNICEYTLCETRYACDCSGSLLCRKRLLRSEPIVVGNEGLADAFAYCVRQPLETPKTSIIPLLSA